MSIAYLRGNTIDNMWIIVKNHKSLSQIPNRLNSSAALKLDLFHFQSMCFCEQYYQSLNIIRIIVIKMCIDLRNPIEVHMCLFKVMKLISNCLFGRVVWASFLTWICMELKLTYSWISSKGRVFIKGHLYAIIFSFHFKSPAVCNIMHLFQ